MVRDKHFKHVLIFPLFLIDRLTDRLFERHCLTQREPAYLKTFQLQNWLQVEHFKFDMAELANFIIFLRVKCLEIV